MWHKSLIACWIILLCACSSSPTNESFIGTGEFNSEEAAKTRVSLGLTYLKNNNFSQAKFNLDRALEFEPRSGEANYAMAYYYQQVKETELANDYFEKALSYSGDDPDILNSYGAFLCSQNKYSEAKKYFLKAVDSERYVGTAQTYENIALCAQKEKKWLEAEEFFLKALSHQPTRPSSLLYLSQIYVEQQKWEQASKTLWKYQRQAGNDIQSLWLAYKVAYGNNSIEQAKKYAIELVSKYPDSEFAQKASDQMAGFQTKITTKTKPLVVRQKPDTVQTSTIKEVEIAPSTEKSDFHVVQAKENLYRISLKYNVKIESLLKWNNLNDASSIRIGSKLRVKEPSTDE